MAEQQLHGAQVGAGLDEMRGVAVPQGVGADRLVDASCHHSGEDPGFFSYVARIPERGQMIAFLSNTDFGMGNCSYELDEQLRNLLLGRPYEIAER